MESKLCKSAICNHIEITCILIRIIQKKEGNSFWDGNMITSEPCFSFCFYCLQFYNRKSAQQTCLCTLTCSVSLPQVSRLCITFAITKCLPITLLTTLPDY